MMLVIVFSYLFGSIPFGYLAGKLFKDIDVRTIGSHNIGFTNVKRLCGWPVALLVLVLDILKGVLPLIWLVPMLVLPADVILARIIAGLAAVLGHTYTFWFKNWKGGKGVATSVGVFAVLSPWGLLIALTVFLLVLLSTKYLSLGSILGILALTIYHFADIIIEQQYLFSYKVFWSSLLTVLIAMVIIYKHRANIKRLLKGQENKFSF